ncbi:MAG: hypothetical protein R2729_27215 [Bryobacteraceae bacterium]
MSLSPSSHLPPPESGPGLKIPILFGIVIALAAANIYLFLQLDQVKTEMTKTRESLLSEISNVRETAQISTQTSRRHLDTLKAELDAARRRAEAAAGQAKEDAIRQVSQLEKKFDVESRKAQEQVRQEISKVEQTAMAANTELKETVSTEVTNVKKDIAANKSELEKTVSDLKKVTGDLGVQSGYIATNGKELAALKALGERNYYEFNIVKSKNAVRVADVTLKLKKADTKRNRFTVELVADDKMVEKKDKNINEPLQFYMAKFRQPCEIVVNSVAKDRISGYLAQPKVQNTRASAN